jgi:hypothetical protein
MKTYVYLAMLALLRITVAAPIAQPEAVPEALPEAVSEAVSEPVAEAELDARAGELHSCPIFAPL